MTRTPSVAQAALAKLAASDPAVANPAASVRRRTDDLTEDAGAIGESAGPAPALRIRVVNCRCKEEVLCVACASIRQGVAPDDFVWGDRDINPADSSSDAPNPGMCKDFAAAARKFIARHEALDGRVNPVRAEFLKVRRYLAGSVLLALVVGLAVPMLRRGGEHAGPVADLTGGLLAAVLVGVGSAVVAMWKLAIRSQADLAFYWKALTDPAGQGELLDRLMVKGEEKLHSALGYLLGEIAIRLGPGRSILVLHTDHDSSTNSNTSVPLALATAAQRWPEPLSIESAALMKDELPVWKGVPLLDPGRIDYAKWANEPSGKECERRFVALAVGADDTTVATCLYLAHSAPIWGGQASLDDMIAFIREQKRRRADPESPDWRAELRYGWKAFRHESLLWKLNKNATQTRYGNFIRSFVWLLAVFPEHRFSPGQLLTMWQKDRSQIPDEVELGKILQKLSKHGVIVQLGDETVQICAELDPALTQKLTLGDPSALHEGAIPLSTSLMRAFWQILAEKLAGGLKELSHLDHALKFALPIADRSLTEPPSKDVQQKVLGAMQARALKAEDEGPLRAAIPWHERVGGFASRGDLDADAAQEAMARAHRLSAWTTEDPDTITMAAHTAFWRLWRAYWVGDRNLLSIVVPDAGSNASWLEPARRCLALGLEFELSGGWSLSPGSPLRLELPAVDAGEEIRKLLAEPKAPRPMRLFCHQLLVAIGTFQRGLSKAERVGDFEAWRACLDDWPAPEAHPHAMGWKLASEARFLHYQASLERGAGEEEGAHEGSSDLGQQTLKRLHEAEAILVESLGLTWGAHELAVDRCLATRTLRDSGVYVHPDEVTLVALEEALRRAKSLRAVTGRLAIYRELIYLNSLFNVPRAIQLADEAVAFCETHGYRRAVCENLRQGLTPILFNAVGIYEHRDRYLDVEDEVVGWLEEQLTRGTDNAHEIRAQLVHRYASMGAVMAKTGYLPRSGRSATECFARADYHLDGIVVSNDKLVWLRIVRLFHELPLHHDVDRQLAICQQIFDIAAPPRARGSTGIDFYLAQTLLFQIEAIERRQRRPGVGRSQLDEHDRKVISQSVDQLAILHGEAQIAGSLDAPWKYLQARLASALAAYSPAQALEWPKTSLSKEGQAAFVNLAFGKQRESYLFDAFKQYCELAEFGPAVIVVRELDELYHTFPQLRRTTEDTHPLEVCRRMLQLGSEPEPEYLFHASHVLYHRVTGRPFFDNYREQQYSEAMYHLESGQGQEAQDRFRKIIEDCEQREDTQILDHDKEAFRQRIDHLRQQADDRAQVEADRLESLRGRLIQRSACEAFLMTATELVKGGQRQYAQTYVNWVCARGTDSQKQRAEQL